MRCHQSILRHPPSSSIHHQLSVDQHSSVWPTAFSGLSCMGKETRIGGPWSSPLLHSANGNHLGGGAQPYPPLPSTAPPPTHESVDDITFALLKCIIQTEWLKIEMLTWSRTRAAVKNKSLYLCCFLRPTWSMESPLKYSGLSLNEIKCDFVKIGCLVLSATSSGRQREINLLCRNLLWAVLLRQFAVCCGKGILRYIYHPPPLATIQPTRSHGAEVPSGAPALLFYIIVGVQGSRRQIQHALQRGSAGERGNGAEGKAAGRWVSSAMQ